MKTRKSREKVKEADPLLQMVSFHLGNENFLVDILRIQEIIRRIEISRMPKAPEYIEGVINLRGTVIPVLDLRKRFGILLPEKNAEERIIVIKTEGKPMGMIVDSVADVLRIPKETIDPAPTVDSAVDAQYISGVAKVKKKLLFLLNLEPLLRLSEQNMP
ncbi:MAG: chemotaxis protein CheW [Deltaproteobacteria bacterium]|nr:chemotaxis protein CheW [Deltaproteobacteria bacterium]